MIIYFYSLNAFLYISTVSSILSKFIKKLANNIVNVVSIIDNSKALLKLIFAFSKKKNNFLFDKIFPNHHAVNLNLIMIFYLLKFIYEKCKQNSWKTLKLAIIFIN